MSYTSADYAKSMDALCPDLSPSCPRCGDLCDPGALICTCGTWLLDEDARRERVATWRVGLGGVRGVPPGAAGTAETVLICPTDLSALDEAGYCNVCGQTMDATASVAVAGKGRNV